MLVCSLDKCRTPCARYVRRTKDPAWLSKPSVFFVVLLSRVEVLDIVSNGVNLNTAISSPVKVPLSCMRVWCLSRSMVSCHSPCLLHACASHV